MAVPAVSTSPFLPVAEDSAGLKVVASDCRLAESVESRSAQPAAVIAIDTRATAHHMEDMLDTVLSNFATLLEFCCRVLIVGRNLFLAVVLPRS